VRDRYKHGSAIAQWVTEARRACAETADKRFGVRGNGTRRLH